MTELEEAALTEGQGRALSATRQHKPIAATPRKLSTARYRLRANVTLTG